MNKIILIGGLTRDPEVKVTSTGKKFAKFSLAISDGKSPDGKDLTQYFNCIVWDSTNAGKLIGIIEMYVKKGHKLAVVGKLQNRSWDKPDGTKGYMTEVLVLEVDLLTSKLEAERINSQSANSDQGGYNQQAPQPQNRDQGNNQEDSEDDKLPEIDVNDINVSMPF
jgi:single-strand DNA-binding protein